MTVAVSKPGKLLIFIGLAVIAIAALIGSIDIDEGNPTAILPAQPSPQPSPISDAKPKVLAQDAVAKSIANCVSERGSAYRKSDAESGNESVITLDMINEFEQDCRNAPEAPNPESVATASNAEEQKKSQSKEVQEAVVRAAQSAKLLTPEAVVWSKHMSLGHSVETLPRTRACDGVRAAVSNLLQQDDKMLELNNRAFKAGYRVAFDDQSRVDLLDRASDQGDWVATQLRCPEWQESRREVLWWFRGLSKQASESPTAKAGNEQISQSPKPEAALVGSEQSTKLLTPEATVSVKYASLRERARRLPLTAGCNAVNRPGF